MKPTERGTAERSTVEQWVDVARRGDPDDAKTRRARMLVASHRDAKLESTLMGDFDAARAARSGDDARIESAISKVLEARMRASSDRLRRPAALDRELASLEPSPEVGAEPARPVEGPRVASAIATPGPQRAVHVEHPPAWRRHGIARLAATLSAGIALGASIALVALGGVGSIGRDPDHDAAPRAAAMDVQPDLEAAEPPRDPREVALEDALALLEESSGDHPSARRLEVARRLVEREDLARAARVLRMISRRWPRRGEASTATLALGHVYVALGWERAAQRVWGRWVRMHPHDPLVDEMRARLADLARVD